MRHYLLGIVATAGLLAKVFYFSFFQGDVYVDIRCQELDITCHLHSATKRFLFLSIVLLPQYSALAFSKWKLSKSCFCFCRCRLFPLSFFVFQLTSTLPTPEGTCANGRETEFLFNMLVIVDTSKPFVYILSSRFTCRRHEFRSESVFVRPCGHHTNEVPMGPSHREGGGGFILFPPASFFTDFCDATTKRTVDLVGRCGRLPFRWKGMAPFSLSLVRYYFSNYYSVSLSMTCLRFLFSSPTTRKPNSTAHLLPSSQLTRNPGSPKVKERGWTLKGINEVGSCVYTCRAGNRRKSSFFFFFPFCLLSLWVRVIDDKGHDDVELMKTLQLRNHIAFTAKFEWKFIRWVQIYAIKKKEMF